MSLVPLLFSDWWEDLDRPHHLLDQDFGLGLHPEQLMSPRRLEFYYHPQRRSPMVNYIRPWAEFFRNSDKGGASTVDANKNNFQVTLDVQHFLPEEIDVKLVDKFVVVTAKHENKRDEHGWISRQFTRKYLIPDQCDIDQVISKLSSDGVLTIQAPRKAEPNMKNEKIIKIQHTGKPSVISKDQETTKKSDQK